MNSCTAPRASTPRSGPRCSASRGTSSARASRAGTSSTSASISRRRPATASSTTSGTSTGPAPTRSSMGSWPPAARRVDRPRPDRRHIHDRRRTMRTFASFASGLGLAALMTVTGAAHAATFVYVSNAEDGDIGTYTLGPDGSLVPGARVAAGKPVMPMSVSPDRRFLYAAVRSKPFAVLTYAIDRKTGELQKRSGAALAESLPYITVDRTGRFLLGASYGGHLVSVNAIGKDGKVSDPQQVIPTARNAHSIITDRTNRWVFVPHLGTDQIFQFRFDAKSGRLTANTPPVVQMKAGSGPRHIIVSPDNRFAYLLNELTATVTTLSLDAKTGLLTEVSTASALPADTKLVPGAPRPSPGRS